MKKTPSTKVELNHNRIARTEGLDEFADILFPRNKNHKRVFLTIFIEIKYSKEGFLPVLAPLTEKYDFSERMLETVRSKLRRLGFIDHVSRFNKRYGYREGWVLSNRFRRSMLRLAELSLQFIERKDARQEQKDRDIFRYL